MSKTYTQLATTDTFQDWFNRTNALSDDMTNIVVTTAANTTGSTTAGNAYMSGILSAETLAVGTGLRGGTVATPADLTISSAAVFSLNVTMNGTLATVNTTTFDVSANAAFTGPYVHLYSSTINIGDTSGDTLTVTATASFNSPTNFSGTVDFTGGATINSNQIIHAGLKATQSDMQTGTDDTDYATPLKVRQADDWTRGRVTISHDDSASYSISTAESSRTVLDVTGTLTADRNLVVPDTTKYYLVVNNTTGGFAITVKTSAGTGVEIGNGQAATVYSDGTNVVQFSAAGSGGDLSTTIANAWFFG